MSALPPIKSFRSMDQIFYQATGEHLSPRAGDEAPIPLEARIQRVQKRQERQRAYKSFYDEMRKLGTTTLEGPTLHGRVVNDIPFDRVTMGQNEPHCPLFCYKGGLLVLTLYPGGIPPPTPAPSHPASPAPTFVLRPPPWLSVSRASSPLALDSVIGTTDEEAAAAPPASRLRKGFAALLKQMPESALWAELEEWKEEEARAREHSDAVHAELLARGKGAGEN